MKVVLAIYNFLVGDMIILIGVVITLLVLALIFTLPFLVPVQAFAGYLLIIAVLLVLGMTLSREVRGR
ncbi:MAG TPA: hypothetical protein VL485_12565 [Ktedonobacteraceae bacterium]|jgi:hypothetical protein|nr:hypothetical protein [Ktedonobacteraceae bacterium]